MPREAAITSAMPTFARWVATPENRAARLAIGHVADRGCSGRPRRRGTNPLFLYGPAGRGKTHLVTSLAHELAGRRPALTAQIIAARDLATQIASQTTWQAGNLESCDLLAIEDVQRLPGRAAETL